MAYSAIIDRSSGKILSALIPDDGGDQWSQFPAVQAVNFASFNADNIGVMASNSAVITTSCSANTYTGVGAVAVSATAGALSLAGAGAGVSISATAGGGDVLITAQDDISVTAQGDALLRATAGATSTTTIEGGVVQINSIIGGGNTGAMNLGSEGAMTLDSNLANITLQTTGAGASGRISLVPATGAVIIGGGATVPNASAGQLVISGGATLAVAGGPGVSTLVNNGATPITQYLPIKIGATSYWIPLLATAPT